VSLDSSVGASGAGIRYVVAGAGGMGREALAWARDALPAAEALAFWVAADGSDSAGTVAGLPVLADAQDVVASGATHVVLGIGDNARRRAVAEEAQSLGLQLLTVVHPTAHIGIGVEVGLGAIIGPSTCLTVDIAVGRAAIVNYGATLGHGCRIGEFSFLGPAVALAGDVVVAEGAFVGIGAVVLPGTTIHPDAVVGGGSVVLRDIYRARRVAGNPAREIP
jgi:UDP-N-acetylbacillosamine N-acetyltransferase